MQIASFISQALLWLLLGGLSLLCLALARQIGVLHERLAPLGALTPSQGPVVGEPAPQVVVQTRMGTPLLIGGPLPAGTTRLLLFVSPDCPICKKLIPLARRVSRSDRLDLVFASDADEGALAQMVASYDLADHVLVNSRELGLAYGVDKLPHAVMLSDAGLLLSRGLVNSREHLESLVVARDLGVASVQDYLQHRETVAA